jgi:hypothetical protein
MVTSRFCKTNPKLSEQRLYVGSENTAFHYSKKH